ncbi:MAG: hypothetical protein RLW61_10805 [Gammaproteobacteria bacterium]
MSDTPTDDLDRAALDRLLALLALLAADGYTCIGPTVRVKADSALS